MFLLQLREYESTIATLQAAQAKAQSENAELLQQATDAESKIGVITKAKNALEAQLDEAKAELESESNVSPTLPSWHFTSRGSLHC